MIGELLSSLVAIFQWPAIGILLIGTLLGSIIAFFPGIGSLSGIVLLFPFAISFDDPIHGVALLLGAHAVMTTADSITAILFGIPGTAGAQAILVDGFPMARQGRGGQALGASLTAASLGGVIGAMCFVVAIPLIQPIVTNFGSPELLVLSLWGISMVGVLAAGSPAKGLAMGALGLCLGTVGIDPQRGIPRYTFDTFYLVDGLPLVAVALGLFAAPQIVELIHRRTLLAVSREEVGPIGYGKVLQGMRETVRNWFLLARSSVMGVFLGIIPGVGGSVIDWLVYGQTAQTTRKNPQFGKGDIRGVIGPDAASNSKEGGQLLPTIGFAIPGGASWAIILSAFLALGITPGTAAFTTRLDLTLSMVWVIVVSNLVAAIGLLAITPYLARVTLLPAFVLVTTIMTFSVLGTFVTNMNVGDVVTLLIFSILGVAMKRQGWPRPPLLLGMVLSPILERYLFISYNRYEWSWITRPGVLIMFAIVAASVLVVIKRSRAANYDEKPDPLGASRYVLGVSLVALAVFAVVEASGWRSEARLAPVACAVAFGVLALLTVVKDAYAARTRRRAELPRPDAPAEDGDREADTYGTTAGLLWFAGALLIVMLLGIPLGVPAAVVLLCRFALGTAWWKVAASLIVVASVIWMFDSFFNIVWFEPVLLRIF